MIQAVVAAFRGTGQLTYRQGAVLVALAGLVFSFTAIVFRAVDDASDWQFLYVRGTSMALAMLALIWVRRAHRPVELAALSWRVVVAGVLLGAMAMLFILALSRTTAATVSFLLASAPMWGAAFGWLMLREPVGGRTLTAIAIAVVGVAVMVGGGIDAGSTSGVVLALALPTMLGLYNTLLRSAPAADPVLPALVAGVVLGAVSAIVAAADTGLAMSLRDALLATLAGGVFLAVGLPLMNLGHQSVPSAQVSLLLMTEIVFTPFWVWIWPGETPSTATLVGGTLVLLAVVWQLTARGRRSGPGTGSLSRWGAVVGRPQPGSGARST